MEKDNHIFQGMRRDNHQIKQKAEFLWDALNIRITNRDDSTLFSITNERGTSEPLISFYESEYVGHCVLGKYLVVFTVDNGASTIHRIEKRNDEFKDVILFSGGDTDKLWDSDNPIQALGSYETDLVQKVYWIDGKHQPRVINILIPELKEIGFEYGEDITDKLGFKDTSFDFVQTLKLEEDVRVEKQYGNGMFAPGVIQYAFTYYNKYGQETNIFYTTPLQYISHKDRGGREDEKVANSFRITLSKLDDFAFVRIYSIHRTSLSAVPTVKLVGDVEIKYNEEKGYKEAVFIDTGTEGSIEDNTKLFYIGGRSIIAGAMAQKDNTLFLGNLKYVNNNSDKVKKLIESSNIGFDELDLNDFRNYIHNNKYYDYEVNLNSYNARFKYNEIYRCGVQAQLSDGTWTDPVYVNDVVLNENTRWNIDGMTSSKNLVIINDGTIINDLRNLGVKKLRACVVFPNVNEREVICQGVLNPTVYFRKDRENEELFNISSWFFRPIIDTVSDIKYSMRYGTSIKFNHGDYIGNNEIQCNGISSNNSLDTSRGVYIDEGTVTFHSPDLEFDTDVQNINWDETYLRIIGVASLGAVSGDIRIDPKSSPYDMRGGINIFSQGYTTGMNTYINGGLVYGNFYKDAYVPSSFDIPDVSNPKPLHYFKVSTWHRSGSLNNDKSRPENNGERTAVLGKKIISNLKFFDVNKGIEENEDYEITLPQLFNNTELNLIKFKLPYVDMSVGYMGNIDRIITSDSYYLYAGDSTEETKQIPDKENNTAVINTSEDPIRMKYKSTPHLIFSLKGSSNEIPVLPRLTEGYKEDEVKWVNPLEGTKLESYEMKKYDSEEDVDGNIVYISMYSDIDALSPSILNGNFLLCEYNYMSGHNNETYHFISDRIEGTRFHEVDITKESYIYRIDSDTVIPNYYAGKLKRFRIPISTVFKESEFNEEGRFIGNFKYIKVDYNLNDKTITSITDVTSLIHFAGEDTGEDVEDGNESLKSFRQVRKFLNLSTPTEAIKPYLWIAEICRKQVLNKFGGNSPEALRNNQWFPAGDPVDLIDGTDDITIPFMYGDTWYQRYDCLKTYPFTKEDENQVVEIGSFMCETRVNIDGRTDRNRGKLSNLDMTPENFNRMNEVYNQKDTFFNYRILDEDFYKSSKYANQVTWTLEKSAGAITDNWTNVTLANTIDMDGSKGEVTSLNVWNNNLLCLQERQLSQLLFNSRVQIPVSDGVPIEISNGRKMEGTRTINDSIGCSDKFTTLTTSNGLYFIDNRTNGLYLFNGQITNLTDVTGMTWWIKKHQNERLRLFNDIIYGDIYIVPDINDNALCFSEKLGQFTSQMNYGGAPAMFNYEDGFYSLYGILNLYRNNVGEYNNFYGVTKPWYFSFISNDNPMHTKVFDTIDLRMDHYKNNVLLNDSPVNFIHVSNEYQEADSVIPNETPLRNKNMMKKFRIWRGNIPRNKGTRQRIRNPWAMITLGHNPIGDINNNDVKVVIHDASVNYTL